MRYFLENEFLKVEAESKGAEIKSVLNIAEWREYMWYGSPRIWGRTSPVLFPFVGSLKNKEYIYDGKAWPMGQHGFARDMEHELVEKTDSMLHFSVSSDASTLAKFPFSFRLDTIYTLSGSSLDVKWIVYGTDDKPLPFSIGAHPAFLCPIHGEANKAGYKLCFDGVNEIHHHGNSRANGLSMDEDIVLELDGGKAVITEDFFDRCTYIVEGNQCGSVGLEDPDGRRFVTVKFDTPLFGIWSPEEKNAPFVCIEPWYGRCDAEDFNGTLLEREFGNTVAPGESFEGGYTMIFG